MWYANTTTVPPSWIAADGSAVSRTTYATLFSVIGTTYGSGNGSTTFNVPNVSATTGKYYIRWTSALGTVTTTALTTAVVGTMMQWPVTSSYPTGWLRCDGSNVSRTSYADLFSLIGVTYGSGDGSTTFTLPNISGSGAGSPVYIIKATNSGLIEPSTVSHAASHIRGGSDIIDADRAQIDFIPTNYTRNSSATGAGATTDLTAHLSGIDNLFGTWTSYTPTLTQLGTVPITSSARYLQLGKLIFVAFNIVITGSGGTGNNPIKISVPITARTTGLNVFTGIGTTNVYRAANVTVYPGMIVAFDGNTVALTTTQTAVTNGSQYLGMSNFGVALATNDQIGGSFIYEAA
jgi:microcystin-dependent protein